MSFAKLCKELEEKIQSSYTEGVTLEEAEKLAGQFLYAQMAVSHELKKADIDSRMRKSGVKTIRAAIYLDIVQKADKKPTEAQIEATINTDEMVSGEQNSFDSAEADRDQLERYYNIFQQAHVHFRQLSRGKFD